MTEFEYKILDFLVWNYVIYQYINLKNLFMELFYLETLCACAAGHPSGEVPMPARGAVIKSLRSQSVSGPYFIVIRQTAYPLGQQRVGHYILGKAQY